MGPLRLTNTNQAAGTAGKQQVKIGILYASALHTLASKAKSASEAQRALFLVSAALSVPLLRPPTLWHRFAPSERAPAQRSSLAQARCSRVTALLPF